MNPSAPTLRRLTRVVRIGSVAVGGENPVRVQSMTSCFTHDVRATLEQIHALEAAGCELVRVTVPEARDASALPEILREIRIPLIADIHYDYKMALASIEAGVHKIRINPGNIGSEERLRTVVDAAREARVPIRIGVNSGSLEKAIEKKHGGATPEAIVESALNHIRYLEDRGFTDILISVKSSSVPHTVRAYRLLATQCDYPLHVGVTEAGSGLDGRTKSIAGIGLLLLDGIGETIRVSLTEHPVAEIEVCRTLLDRVAELREQPA
ncbi:MAG: flavodoxin-dependent (E)-4-hydroxy-3-methylbut-2-enyl-diphosphate synthase [Candidatus Wallbacteria bacterium]|nr:flavodoxin-dependent (E)-4-hydroxy-3-methylbut-2-enyl-diphosphate synthase [Candidatus Wallbacteria bacterium]